MALQSGKEAGKNGREVKKMGAKRFLTQRRKTKVQPKQPQMDSDEHRSYRRPQRKRRSDEYEMRDLKSSGEPGFSRTRSASEEKASSPPPLSEAVWRAGQRSRPRMEYLFNVFGGTLSGFRFNGPPTQGSLALLRKAYGGQANLGWRTQSRW